MKMWLSIMLALVMVLSIFTVIPFGASAEEVDVAESSGNISVMPVNDDDYPSKYSVPAQDSVVDEWNFYNRECTSFCAWRLNSRNGVAFHNWYGSVHWGNASNWGNAARSLGITVNNSPARGAIAWWSTGHVAWVNSVRSDGNVIIEEYNCTWRGVQEETGRYLSRVITADFPTGYIHLNDLTNDKTGPSFDDFHVGEIQSDQFTVMAHVTDSSGVSSVRYAVWSDKNGQDDLIWYDGHCTDGNDYYWCHVKFSEHNNEKGNYIIHMYAYDNAGNVTNPGISFNFDSKGPSFEDFHVGEFREGAFTVMAKVTSENGVSSVKYAVWSDKNGQDDIKWYDGKCTDNNDYYWAHVNFSEHNNEKGNYIIHMYAYDTAGQLTNPGISYVFPETGPTVTNVKVSDISSAGYTITCNVSDEIGVLKVQFPTWTEKDGQDDLVSEWWNNKKVRGTINGNTVTFRVNTSEHNRETGKYITHLYAYDKLGTSTKVVIPAVDVPSPISNVKVSDIEKSGFTVTWNIDNTWGPIGKVECGTWTEENGQDDLVWHQGTYSNGKATCRILTRDHHNDTNGIYLTHIYVWDNDGHNAAVNQIDYPCLRFDYGKALNNPTEPNQIILGDADSDGVVTIIDATQIQKKLAELPVMPTFNEDAARVDGDEKLNILDATYIQKWLASIPVPYLIGEPVS